MYNLECSCLCVLTVYNIPKIFVHKVILSIQEISFKIDFTFMSNYTEIMNHLSRCYVTTSDIVSKT